MRVQHLPFPLRAGATVRRSSVPWLQLASEVLRDLLSWSASVIGHVLDWPVMIVATALIFRSPITGLIGRVRRYKGMGGEVDFFIERAAEAASEAERTAARRAAEDTSLPPAKDAEPPDDAATVADPAAPTDDGGPHSLRRRMNPPPAAVTGGGPMPRASETYALARLISDSHPTSDTIQAIRDEPELAIRAAWSVLTHATRRLVARSERREGLVADIADAADRGELDYNFAEGVVELHNAYRRIRRSPNVDPESALRFVDTALDLTRLARRMRSAQEASPSGASNRRADPTPEA